MFYLVELTVNTKNYGSIPHPEDRPQRHGCIGCGVADPEDGELNTTFDTNETASIISAQEEGHYDGTNVTLEGSPLLPRSNGSPTARRRRHNTNKQPTITLRGALISLVIVLVTLVVIDESEYIIDRWNQRGGQENLSTSTSHHHHNQESNYLEKEMDNFAFTENKFESATNDTNTSTATHVDGNKMIDSFQNSNPWRITHSLDSIIDMYAENKFILERSSWNMIDTLTTTLWAKWDTHYNEPS